MKKIFIAFAALIALAACGNKQATTSTSEGDGANNEVAFTVAKNYFFKRSAEGRLQGKNDLNLLPASPKITSEEVFNKHFGMATTMGEDGKPTPIDFTKQFVLAIVLPVTDMATEVNPVKVEEKGDSLLYTYKVKTGEKQSYSIQPISIIILDKKYENKEVVLVNEQEITYVPAIDRYLIDKFGKHYAEGEYCVPIHNIVAVDERNAEGILIWGDFWVFNYNQVGDTLKCVSGGSHPGRMHITQTENGFEVTAFDQVEDGSRFLPTAKKIFGDNYDVFLSINSDEKKREMLRAEGLAKYVKEQGLSATMYQDYGWPAKELK